MTTRLHSRLPTIALFALLVSPGAQAVGTARGEKTFLWKVTSGKGEVYLLGSMHLAKKDLYPLAPEIEDAFARSKHLAVEADEDKAGPEKIQQVVQEKGLYPEGDSLSKHLSKEASKKLGEFLAKSGGSIEQVERFRPWYLSIALSMQALLGLGLEPDQGIDRHFMKEAKEKSKEILEVESVDFQIKLLSGLTEEEQNTILLSTLDEIDTMGKEINRMVQAWKKGDAAELEKMAIVESQEKHPEWLPLRKKLLDDRNVGMAAKVEEYLKKEGPFFVVVGAAHLVGEKGVVRLLQEKGYKVEQVERK